MSNCPVCGRPMARFKNPDREICPNLPNHPSGSTLGRRSREGKGVKGGSKRVPKKDR